MCCVQISSLGHDYVRNLAQVFDFVMTSGSNLNTPPQVVMKTYSKACSTCSFRLSVVHLIVVPASYISILKDIFVTDDSICSRNTIHFDTRWFRNKHSGPIFYVQSELARSLLSPCSTKRRTRYFRNGFSYWLSKN